MALRVRKKDLVFIISLVVIFAQYIKIFDLGYYCQFIVALLWVIYDYVNIIYTNGIKGRYSDEIKFFRKIYLTPWIVIALYTLFIFFNGLTENVPLITFIGSNTTILINILFAFSALHLFKEKALSNSIIALGIIYVLVTVNAIITRGPLIVITQFIDILTTFNSDKNPFEIGDCTFAAGLIFLVYLFYGRKHTKKERKYLFIFGFFIILGLKRIQILSMVSVVFIGMMLKIVKSKYSKNLLMHIVTLAFVVVSTGFIFFIDSDSNLLAWTGLDMGRYHLYSFINDYFDYSIGFLGHGYGFSNRFVELNTRFSITVLHSDIIRMFVEIGFLGFYIWMIYYLILARKTIEKNYGMDCACKYFFMTFYLFITYFTDNTVNYFVTQYFNCILLTSLIIGNSFFQSMTKEENEAKGSL